MRKLIVILVGMSMVGSAMARYWIYDVRVSGAGIECQEDKGKDTHNGVTQTIDKYAKSSGSLRGYLVFDEYEDWCQFLAIDKGGYYRDSAELEEEILEWYQVKSVSTMDDESFSGKGTVVYNVYLEAPDMNIWFNCIGNVSERWSWSMENGEECWKYKVSASGAGGGSQDIENISWREAVYVNNAKMKYNQKLSAAMSDAYYDALDGGASEQVSVQAAADELNAFINGKAKIDWADFFLPGL